MLEDSLIRDMAVVERPRERLAHGIECGLMKHGIAFENLQRPNCAIGADESVEFDAAFPAGLTG